MVLDYNSELESLIFDEDKIVTYKLVNQKFDLTPFEAKNVLKEFIKKHRDGDPSQKLVFYVTYLVIGEHRETKKKQILVVNEQDIEGLSNDYKVISKQIYSIQKNFIEDFDLIHGSDLNISNDLKRKSNLNTLNIGMRDETKCSSNIPTSSSTDSISASSSWSSNSTKSSKVSTLTSNASATKSNENIKQEAIEHHETSKSATTTAASTSSTTTATKKPTAATGGIAAMFKQQQSKKPTSNETSSEKSSDEKQTTIKKESPKKIKQESPPKKITKISPEAKKTDKNISKAVMDDVKKEFDEDIEMVDEEDLKKPKKNEKKEKKTSKKNEKTKKNEETLAKSDLFDDEEEDEETIANRNKRNKEEEEEEGEDDEIDDDDDDEQISKKKSRKAGKRKQSSQLIDSDDDEQNEEKKKANKKPKIKKPENNKEIDSMLNKENHNIMNDVHHKKQLVTKTFIDKDGYKVTQKVWETVEDDKASQDSAVKVTESKNTSENHALKDDKQKKLVETTHKQQQSKALNQPTLTSFFKRT